jgi:hypothetical protein
MAAVESHKHKMLTSRCTVAVAALACARALLLRTEPQRTAETALGSMAAAHYGRISGGRCSCKFHRPLTWLSYSSAKKRFAAAKHKR